MKEPIKIESDYNWIYEIFRDKIVLKNNKGKKIVVFGDGCEYLEQALFIFKRLKEQPNAN
jgi:hypothetical protein